MPKTVWYNKNNSAKGVVMEQKKPVLPFKSALIYAIGIFGVQLFIGYINSFQTEFYNKMYSGLDSNIFYVVAVIILVAKIISCIADPIFGALIDRSHFKGGKMRPFVLMSAFPIAILTTLMFVFIDFSNKYVMYVYITVTTVLWNVAMTFADIPSQGMLALLSPDPEERNVAAGLSNTFKSIALAAPGVFVTVVMMILDAVKGAGNYSDQTYYLITALVFLVLGTALYLLMYFKNREAVVSTTSNSVSFKEMFVELKRNKMIRIVFLTFILGFARNMAMGICVQAGGALIGKVYFPLLSDILAGGGELDPTSNATWLIGITNAVTAMVSIVVVPMINKKWGEKKTFIVFAVYGFAISLACTLFYILLPADSALRGGLPAVWAHWIMLALIGFMFGPHGYLPLVMTSDICDYNEWKTGDRHEGVCFAILSMSNKISNALSVAVGILFVGISGYTAGAEITPKMQNIIYVAYVGLPGLSCILSMIPMLWYKIDEKTKAEMHAELAERRKQIAEIKG